LINHTKLNQGDVLLFTNDKGQVVKVFSLLKDAIIVSGMSVDKKPMIDKMIDSGTVKEVGFLDINGK
jgi:hypothetical protein